MPRVLGVKSQRLVIEDPVSGSKITLHYRLPTSEERVAYQLAAYRLEGASGSSDWGRPGWNLA